MHELHEIAKARAQLTYNMASDHFDDMPLAFWDRAGRGTVQHLDLVPGMCVLDVGCGSGASALPAAERVGPNGRVIAVDLADKLLAMGRIKATRRKLANVIFQMGDMEDLEFSNGYFDAVISVFSIFFVPNMVGQVRELWRMVRPGGQLAITTWGPNFCSPMYERWLQAVDKVRPDLSATFNPWDDITTTNALRKLLGDAGIHNADIRLEYDSQALNSPEDWWTILLGLGTRWTVEQLGKETATVVRQDNLNWAYENGVESVETNIIYSVVTKPL